MKISFASDNNSGVHPEILAAVNSANIDHFVSYGDDPYTTEAKKIFKNIFGDDSETFFMLTGTGANVTALQCLTNRFEAIICTDMAHINVDECGAPEHALGSKVITIPTKNGKLSVEAIEKYMHYIGDQHHVQPKTISITQPTELGTLYTIEELKSITNYAKKNGLKVHLDGARIANAAVALNCSIKELTADIGISALSFGGTKNGMLLGEAVTIFDLESSKDIPFIRKQNMQLYSKMRFVSSQFIAYFKDNLYIKNATQANNMAKYLYQKLAEVRPEIMLHEPECNAVFVKLPRDKAAKMQKQRFFYTWDEEENIYRFMTSFDMTNHDIDDFVQFVHNEV